MRGLQPVEAMVLAAIGARASSSADAVAGHFLRRDLQAAGLAKREIALAVQALVDAGILDRVRRDDPDGSFYTAYRPTPRGDTWLRAHGEGHAMSPGKGQPPARHP